MIAFSVIMSMAFGLLLAILIASTEAYETRINHSPWWARDNDNSIENSYQYYYPYHRQQQQQQQPKRVYWNYPTRDQAKQKKVRPTNNRWKFNSFNKDRKKDNFDWDNYLDFDRMKMPNIPPVRKTEMKMREWPAYHLLPPIRMISLPLDEPPQP